MAGVEERVASLETQVQEIGRQDTKIDKIMDLVSSIKDSISEMKNNYMPKEECKTRCAECDKKFTRSFWWQKAVIGAIITGTVTILLFLLEELFKWHITISSGG